jgi:hypothetical protein
MRELYARELESRRRIAKLQAQRMRCTCPICAASHARARARTARSAWRELQAKVRERDETHRLMTQQLAEMRSLQALLHAQARRTRCSGTCALYARRHVCIVCWATRVRCMLGGTCTLCMLDRTCDMSRIAMCHVACRAAPLRSAGQARHVCAHRRERVGVGRAVLSQPLLGCA